MLAKILKWLTGSRAKSYQIKYAVRELLETKSCIAEEELGVILQEVIHHQSIRGMFNSVHPELKAEGVTRVELGMPIFTKCTFLISIDEMVPAPFSVAVIHCTAEASASSDYLSLLRYLSFSVLHLSI